MKKAALMCITVLSLTIAGCQADSWGTKQTVGTGVGAVAGGLAGSQFGKGSGRLWATGAGVLLGGLAGSSVGQSLDQSDRMAMQSAQQRAYRAPIGESVYWNNPRNNHSGTYVATRDGISASGRYCREYQQIVVVGGEKQSGYGTACQQPDGSWEIME